MEIPLCDTCGHRHEQGIRCEICGHVGKSQIFPKMRLKANEKRACTVELLYGSQLTDSPLHHSMIINLRHMSFSEDWGIDLCSYRDVNPDIDYHLDHIIIFSGDLPVAAARFALRPGTISDEYGNNHELVVLNIDELCVLPSHRCRGFAYTCFYSILQQLQVNNMYSSISAMQIKVVEGSWQMQKLVAGGFACRDHTVSAQITEAMNAESVQIKMVPMLLSMSCESKDSLLGYLRQRSNIG